MLDPEIKTANLRNMTEEDLDRYFTDATSEIEEYIYGGSGADRKDFMFDAMSMISWKNALDMIEVPLTPFQPIGKVQSSVIEHRKLRDIGRLCRKVMDVQTKSGQKVFVRTDVGVATNTLTQLGDGNRYPGLKRGLTAYDRVNVDDSLRIAQYLSPNPEYIFLVQFVYVGDVLYHTYNVEDSKILGYHEEKFAPFVQNIIDKFESLHIRPRHPQYNEHGTKNVSFKMTVVDSPNGPEVFSASAYDLRVGKPAYLVNKL
jgi:hypothetical protein